MSFEQKQEWVADDYSSEDQGVIKPSVWPLIAQALLIVFSLALFFAASIDQHLSFGLVGYLFTPFAVVTLLAYMRGQDLKNRALSNYDRALGRKYQVVAGFLAITSFIIAMPIIWRIAIEIAQEIGALG